MNNIFTKTWVKIAASVLSGCLLAIPYNYPFLYLLTWVAFVPLLLCIHTKEQPTNPTSNSYSNPSSNTVKSAYFCGLLLGFVFYGIAASWITDFVRLFKGYGNVTTIAISIFFWIYCSQLPALLFAIYQWIINKKLAHPIILFPCLVLAFYGFFPMLFSVQLGESQSQFLIALQGIEYTGAYGLDFIIGLTNILIAQTLLMFARRNKTGGTNSYWFALPFSSLVASIIILSWFSFGLYSFYHWQNTLETWPTQTVGIVQPNEKPNDKIPPPADGYSYTYPPELAFSESIMEWSAKEDKSIDFIVWPETRYKGYLRYPLIENSFTQAINNLNVPVIFQDIETQHDQEAKKTYSAVLHIDSDGKKINTYHKIKRVPFGEYVPVINESHSTKKWLAQYFGEFYSNFSAGDAYNFFTMKANTNSDSNIGDGNILTVNLIPLVCYEVMFPDFAAKAVANAPKNNSTILLALSNNGWFGESLQPYQHLYSSVLRSVENRISLVHAVNNGPSAVVSPSGELLFISDYHQQGAFVTKVPIAPTQSLQQPSQQSDSTFFTKRPYFFIQCIFILLFSNIITVIIFKVFKKKNNHS